MRCALESSLYRLSIGARIATNGYLWRKLGSFIGDHSSGAEAYYTKDQVFFLALRNSQAALKEIPKKINVGILHTAWEQGGRGA